MFTFVLFILFIATVHAFLDHSSFKLPIHDLTNPQIQEAIKEHAQNLANTGVFHLKDFYSDDILQKLRHKALFEAAPKGVRRDVFKSVLGDQADLENFAEDHPRNILGNLKMTFVGKSDLPREFVQVYEYEPLLRFLEAIVTAADYDSSKTAQQKWESLHLSKDKEGSVYVFLGGDGDRGEWHLDQHPFSCVHMLSRPTEGGNLLYFHHPPMKDAVSGEFVWDWDLFGQIQHNQVAPSELVSSEGDIYCFQGNVTWHASGPIGGDKTRSILVMAYADFPDFTHSKHVHELNAWGEHATESEKCMGNQNCVQHDADIKTSATDAVHRHNKHLPSDIKSDPQPNDQL